MLIGKFIVRMLDAEVFLVSQIDEPVITSPTIGMNDAFKVYTSTYDALESGSGAIRNDFRLDVIIAFEQAENNGFPRAPRPLMPLTRRAPK